MSPNLDFLRAIAVSCVFFAHFAEAVSTHRSPCPHYFGQLGVILFFVHTSLVLMQSLDRSKLDGWPRAREFFIHRAFRIYPLAVVCVMVAYLIPNSNWSPFTLLTNLTLTMNLFYENGMVGGLWSLPLEVQMYLVLPVMYVVLRNRPAAWFILAAAALIIIGASQPYISKRLSMLEYAPCFFAGVIAWRIGIGRGSLPAWLWPLAIAVAALPWLMGPGRGMPTRWATCIALGLMIPWFSELSWKPLTTAAANVAKYSYGIYLTHAAALKVAFGAMTGEPAPVQFLAFGAMAVLLPLAAYHLIEAPMIRYGKVLAARRIIPSPAELPRAA